MTGSLPPEKDSVLGALKYEFEAQVDEFAGVEGRCFALTMHPRRWTTSAVGIQANGLLYRFEAGFRRQDSALEWECSHGPILASAITLDLADLNPVLNIIVSATEVSDIQVYEKEWQGPGWFHTAQYLLFDGEPSKWNLWAIVIRQSSYYCSSQHFLSYPDRWTELDCLPDEFNRRTR